MKLYNAMEESYLKENLIHKLQVFVSTNGWDIDIVAAKKKYNELLLEYKDEIIRQINNKKVLRAHWKKKTIQR